MRVSSRHKEAGFTLIEVLIALFVLAFGILGLTKMQISAIQGNGDAKRFSTATAIGQAQIEALMSLGYGAVVNGSNVVNGYAVQWTVTGEQDFDGDGSNDLKTVSVTVDDPTGDRKVALSFAKAANL